MASRDGNNYLLITMGAPLYEDDGSKANGQFEDHEKIYEWAFNTFEYKKIVSSTEEITEVPVKLGDGEDHVTLVPAEDFYALWPNTLDEANIKTTIDKDGYLDSDDSVVAPIKKGQVLGKYTISLSGETICSVDLVANKDIALSQLEYNIMKAKAFVGSFWFKMAVGAAAALIAAYIVVYVLATKKRRRKVKRVSKNGKRRL